MRTFLAFNISEDLREEISNIMGRYRHYRNIKWVEKENLHITLHFLGDTRQQDLSELDDIFSESFSKTKSFNIINPQLNVIPSDKPRIVWAQVYADNEAVLNTVRKMRQKLSFLNYKTDNKSSKLHITFGRIKGYMPKDFFAAILMERILKMPSRIKKAVFYESVLKPNGPDYYPLKSYELAI